MLTTRTFMLTATGLLAAFAATAQSTTAPAGPQPVDVLSWITWGAAAIVLLMAIITGASVTGAAQRRYTEAAQPATALTLTTATTSPNRPALVPPVAAEAVAA